MPHAERPVTGILDGARAVPAGRAAALDRLPDLLFGVALVLHAIPTLALARFPTQDGPLHVENVMALLRRDSVEVFRSQLVVNWGLQPNWLTQLLFAGLATVLPPLLAQRLVLTGAVVALPLAARFALPRTPRGRWAALAVFPFLYSFPFHMGFWNFTYGLALFLVAIGLWRRARGRITAGRGALLAAVLVVAYFCHTVAVSSALVAIALSAAWRAVLSFDRARRSPARRRIVLRAHARHTAALALVAAPAALLLLRFLARHQDHHAVRLPFLTLAGKLASLYTLVSLDRREVLLSLPVAFALGAAITIRLVRLRWGDGPRARPADGWLIVALAFAVLYFAIPDVAASGAQISDRLALLPFLAAILWLGAAPVPLAEVRRVAALVLVLALAALAVRLPRWRAIDQDLAEYASVAGSVGRGTVLLPVTYQPYGIAVDGGGRQTYRVRMFQHAAGYVAAERDALDLDNAQLNTDYGPLRLARGPRPIELLGPGDALEGDPPCVNLDAWRAAGGRLDFVLLYGATPGALQDACSQRMLEALRRDYEPVTVSQPRGLVQVFRQRGDAPAPNRTAAR